MTEPKSDTLDVPGAVLHYDLRIADATTEPVLMLIGSPMTADGFASLAARFPDRTVLTYDPRSAGRSVRTDGATQTTPDEHADDLHRLVGALGIGPVEVFASSGGAVNALVWVSAHPEQVATLIAHEPPAFVELPDAETLLAATADIRETYLHRGYGAGMAKFIALVSIPGPLPADYADRAAPDPATFGLPADDDGSRDDALLGQQMRTTPSYRHDFDALRAASTRIVVGVGTQSGEQVAGRAALAVAARLGATAVSFPGGHDGFVDGGFGGHGEPDAFAATLREVLAHG
jgi:pimeloyl-ACP methyl ester carboxylesterase